MKDMLPPFFRFAVDVRCFDDFVEEDVVRGMQVAGCELVLMDTLKVKEGGGVIGVRCEVSGSREEYCVNLVLGWNGLRGKHSVKEVWCTCPHKTYCKHAAALLLILTSDWSGPKPIARWAPTPRPTLPKEPPKESLVNLDSLENNDNLETDVKKLFFSHAPLHVPDPLPDMKDGVISPRKSGNSSPWRGRNESSTSPRRSPVVQKKKITVTPNVKKRILMDTPARSDSEDASDDGETLFFTNRETKRQKKRKTAQRAAASAPSPYRPLFDLADAPLDADLSACLGSSKGSKRVVSSASKPSPEYKPKVRSSTALSLSDVTPIPSAPHERFAKEVVCFTDMLGSL
eukprot:TRINITY_DN1851_c3_g1_i1.p1 TRINITY_DN1851_c3_g1~~TRINITY_DN1851_c3_g1_i1.p1  ORF type:complete len:359 (+),score=49.51 TRINITY_DN1851_c3_g1_i1:48-1079(+)